MSHLRDTIVCQASLFAEVCFGFNWVKQDEIYEKRTEQAKGNGQSKELEQERGKEQGNAQGREKGKQGNEQGRENGKDQGRNMNRNWERSR